MAIRERDLDDGYGGDFSEFGSGFNGNSGSFGLGRGRGGYRGRGNNTRGAYRGNSGYDCFEGPNDSSPFGEQLPSQLDATVNPNIYTGY